MICVEYIHWVGHLANASSVAPHEPGLEKGCDGKGNVDL